MISYFLKYLSISALFSIKTFCYYSSKVSFVLNGFANCKVIVFQQQYVSISCCLLLLHVTFLKKKKSKLITLDTFKSFFLSPPPKENEISNIHF